MPNTGGASIRLNPTLNPPQPQPSGTSSVSVETWGYKPWLALAGLWVMVTVLSYIPQLGDIAVILMWLAVFSFGLGHIDIIKDQVNAFITT